MAKIVLLKKLDSLLGPVLVRISSLLRPRGAALGKPASVLLLRPGGIGDAVLLMPAIVALKESFPDAVITVLAERRNGSAFSLCPAVDHLLLYDRPADLWKAIRGGYQVVIDTEQWHRLSAVVARLTRAPVSIGFATNDRKRLFAHRAGYSHEEYEAASFFRLLAPLGITPPATVSAPFLTVPEKASRRVAELLPLSGKPLLTVFPGASIAERRWGGERYREVADLLAGEGVLVAVVGGKEDAEEGEMVVAGCGGVNLAGKTSLAETAAVIARSALLISGDSGVLHIAVGLGVPTVSLFGPGIEAKWGPKGEGDVVLNRRLSCSPCTRFGTTPPCPIQARCLSGITPLEVAQAARELLARLDSRV